MKTCELDGCSNLVKTKRARFCSRECSDAAKTFLVYTMVENCIECGAKMMDGDYYKALRGTACSQYCKACRVEQREERVEAKKDSRKDFSLLFNSMASSGRIKF